MRVALRSALGQLRCFTQPRRRAPHHPGRDEDQHRRADIDDLIRHVRTNAAALADRICLWFFSGSGVHLESGLGTNASFVRCMVGYYPLLAPSRRIPMSDALRRQFTAAEQIKRHASKVPPLLLVKAGLDSLSLNQALDEFRQQATSSGVTLELLEHPSGEHAFDIRNDDDTSRDIVRRTFEFVKQHLCR